jgi:class 3 adenylate cyclase/tetratricopeptide (TPR) repeat protein
MFRLSALIILLFCFSGTRVSAQNQRLDSLIAILNTLKSDSTKVNMLIDIGNEYLAASNVEEAFRYGEWALDLTRKINYVNGEGYSLKLLGQVNIRKSNYPEAITQFKASLEAFESINNNEGESNILGNLGSVYFITGDDAKSIEYHLRSLKIGEEINNKLRISTSLLNLGTVYANKPATTNQALSYFLRALPIFEEINYEAGIGIASMNIGEIYFNKGSYDSALLNFQRSIRIYEGTADAAFPLSYIGEIYTNKNDFEKAFSFHRQAIDVCERLDAQFELAQSLLSLGKSEYKMGQIKQSIATNERALKIAKEVDAPQERKKAYEALSVSYAELRDFSKAYRYEKLLTGIKDTLYNTDEDKKIQQLQFNADMEKKESEIQLQDATIQRQKAINVAAGISGSLLILMLVGVYQRYKFIRKTNKIIQDERDRSKELLLNILPEETARELETNGYAQTRYYESVTVLFTDFKGFSTIAGKLSPQELVAELNDYFMAFDEIMGKYNLEKIKTIGDAYMCAGGIPTSNTTHPLDAVQAALAMQEYMTRKNDLRKEKNLECWELRVGLHTGPIVAGVVGKKKYAYDIWGDTVNIASRMESNGEPGKVNISASTYEHVKGHYQCLYRGKISAKNIGEVDMYFIESKLMKPVATLAKEITA